ncbi:uncharacterized protein BO72DRAFT_50019 [Aspergillus fijiensis CBS 313.89]|uniref:Uncharacterized protein n=1 Tax=Aspergillus fijiensis CBS 313.89 TaxID=1448319 RepID=A0A8G1RCK8_9EURO|nr:uncharacterized protein BO72DRAFT_50019 [Aspergillus fijiensis CBS 313.89]RAK70824.1 hypothetical protein BO72DRAFT_50019 [Aspergillus fijiensis CBS 313.89]
MKSLITTSAAAAAAAAAQDLRIPCILAYSRYIWMVAEYVQCQNHGIEQYVFTWKSRSTVTLPACPTHIGNSSDRILLITTMSRQMQSESIIN